MMSATQEPELFSSRSKKLQEKGTLCEFGFKLFSKKFMKVLIKTLTVSIYPKII